MTDKGTISTLSIWSDDQKTIVALSVAGMSQADIAARLGVDQRTIGRWLDVAALDVETVRADGFDVVYEIPEIDA